MRVVVALWALGVGCAPEEGRDTGDTASDRSEASDTWDTADADDTSEATVELVETAGVRAWADGELATSCRAYRDPTKPYLYAGATGDGTYRIDPDGAGEIVAFDAYCDMTSDGGGWTLIAQSVPTSDTSANQCVPGAVGALDLDAVTVSAPAKLADASIDAIWAGGGKEIRMLGELGASVTTPTGGWDTDCLMDFVDTQAFTAVRGATWTPEVDAVSCLTGDTPLYAVYDEPDTCGYAFRMQGGDYFIWTYDTDYTLHCGGATAGRSWPASSGNNGCNTSKTWVR